MTGQQFLVHAGAAFLLLFSGFGQAEDPLDTDVNQLITAGGTLTDIAFALHKDDSLIGVDTSSTSPAAVNRLPKVGYYRNLSAEGILSFEPEHLWVLEGGGSDRVLQQIEGAGVSVVVFDKPTSLQELYELIENMADRFGAQAEGKQVIAGIKSDLTTISSRKEPLKALFVLQASERGVVAAGTDTVPDLLFSYSDINNVFSHNGFKTVSTEYLLAEQPDFLVAPEHVVKSHGSKEAFCQAQALKLLEAGKNCRVLVMDSLLALGMTTRIAEAQRVVAEFANELAAGRE